MTPELILNSRLAAIARTRLGDRNFLAEILIERQECLACGLTPFGTDAQIAERIKLLGGMAAAW